jgi:RHS repeat-associated protein
MLTYATKSFTYNLNGEVESVTDSATSLTTTFSYDVLGNLKSVVLPSKTVNYTVDARNRRMSKRNGGTVEQFYVWNIDNQLVGIANSSGNLVSQFVYGTKSYVPDYMIQGGVNYKIVKDHLGSPILVINSATGATVQKITYDHFGKILTDTSPGLTPFGFAGCLYDVDTELCRFGARDYDASIGRWLSKDPILFGGGDTNLYGYVMQDPINFIDPDGLARDFASKPDRGGAGGGGGGINYIVSPSGTVYPVPKGAIGPVNSPSLRNGPGGSAFTGGRGGSNGQVWGMRITDPAPARGSSPGYPNGYIKYFNKGGQNVDPYSGKTLPNSCGHLPLE